MSNQESSPAPPPGAADESAIESKLGQVLAIIHRILPKLDDPSRSREVQAALSKASISLEAARSAHEHLLAGPKRAPSAMQQVSTGVEPEIAAVIAAAIAVLFDRPYRLVSVQQVATPVPHLNVWALEGRTQIFQSHRIR